MTRETGTFANFPQAVHAMDLEHTLCGDAFDACSEDNNYAVDTPVGPWVPEKTPRTVNCEKCCAVADLVRVHRFATFSGRKEWEI